MSFRALICLTLTTRVPSPYESLRRLPVRRAPPSSIRNAGSRDSATAYGVAERERK